VCPACGEWVTVVGQLTLGLKLVCDHCDTNVTVVELNPVELEWADYGKDKSGMYVFSPNPVEAGATSSNLRNRR